MKFLFRTSLFLLFAVIAVAGLFFYLQPKPASVSAQSAPSNTEWYMAGANPQRTSWVSEEVHGDIRADTINVEWYRPIEAYIPQNVQIIATNGLLYISTARGLYVLNAVNGEIVWRFDTQLPLGNSPTVIDGVVYVGGYDKKIHALNANNGTHLWEFSQAEAGFDTNPLVVNGKIYAGNRDGNMYCIGAHNTPQQGQLIWKYPTQGPIHFSAAYKDNTIYFASNDNSAYALNAETGSLVWKSDKLPGDGFHAWWPVIYQDKVVFPAATISSYRTLLHPGTITVDGRDPYFHGGFEGVIGPTVQVSEPWAEGKTVIDGSLLCEFLEDNPNRDPYLHKPWQRSVIFLNGEDGSEYTFDSDQDGFPEYAPYAWFGTHTGNRYPPVVGPDDVFYDNNLYSSTKPNGAIMGWKIGTHYLTIENNTGVTNEPEAVSLGGNTIYRSVCCDRIGVWSTITGPSGNQKGTLWDYWWENQLNYLAPGYDIMWHVIDAPGLSRIAGNYGTKNGIYHSHGYQNPLVPHQGKLYIHRSNAVIAFGSDQGPGQLPLLEINQTVDQVSPPPPSELKQRLEKEIQKMIAAGHLRIGYYSSDLQVYTSHFADYFGNPGDTLLTLTLAYPYLSTQLQQSVSDYLKNEYQTYFQASMITSIGWSNGTARETFPLPLDIEEVLPGLTSSTWDNFRFSWYRYPQHNFYALWKYAQLFPEDAQSAYNLALSRLEVPAPADDLYLAEWTMEHNAYIAGYLGFLNLQKLAGKDIEDAQLRTQVQNELNRLIELRGNTFTKDTFWDVDSFYDSNYSKRVLNISRNFMMMVPELADYLRQHALSRVQEAIDEYNYTAPYWFAARYEATVIEQAMQNLFDYPALFQAKAYILKEPYEELVKYLDVPAFEKGDLFYIQNLVAAIQTAQSSPSPSTTPGCQSDINGDGTVNLGDIVAVLGSWGQSGGAGDLNGDGTVNLGDVVYILNFWGQAC